MPAVDQHPTPDQLSAFALGQLDDSASSVEEHVTRCPDCQQAAARAPDDTLVSLLRAAGPLCDGGNTPAASAGNTAVWEDGGSEPSTPPELVEHPRYRLIRPLGSGGMGTVWLAEHKVMGRQVALKVIRPEHLAKPGAAERFRREVHAAARLHHPNIVAAHDAERAGATHFLVMEYVEGVSLAEHLSHNGPLPVAEACRLAHDAALGLQHAQAHGLVHRDIKPHNLILAADGTLKVLDFGLATLAAGVGGVTNAGLTGANMVLGTPDYIAPEQAEDPHAADIRADVYSLGCTLYHMLAGRVPFPGDSALRKLDAHRTRAPEPLAKLRRDVPPGLAAVLERMMAKDPAMRYQTPAEVAAALEPFTRPVAVNAHRPRRVAAALAALFAGIVLAGVVVYRIQTDTGELVITTESDDVEVSVRGDKFDRVIDTKTDKEIKLALRSGVYELELKGAPEGLKLTIDKATLTRGKTVLAKIERTPKPAGQVASESAPVEIRALRTFTGHEKLPPAIIFRPDGKRLISAGLDGTIRFWDVATGEEEVRRRLTVPSCPFGAVSVSRDGKQLLSAGNTGVVPQGQMRLWDLSTGKMVREFAVPATGITTVRFSPDDRQALSGHFDGSARVWDVGTGKEVQSITHPGPRYPGGEVFSADWSPDGRWVVSGTYNHLAVWVAATGKIVREWIPPAISALATMAFTPDGKRVVTGHWGCVLKVFDIETGNSLLSVEVPYARWSVEARERKGGGVTVCFAPAPDNRRILITAPLSTPELWELSTGKVVGRLVGHQAIAYGAAFSPDGRYAATTSEDKTIRLWRLPEAPPAKDKP